MHVGAGWEMYQVYVTHIIYMNTHTKGTSASVDLYNPRTRAIEEIHEPPTSQNTQTR